MRRNFYYILILQFLISCSSLNFKTEDPRYAALDRSPAAISKVCNELFQEILGKKFVKVKKSTFNEISKVHGVRKAKDIQKNLDALLFIDYPYSHHLLSDIYQGEADLAGSDIFKLFDDSGGNPFGNFVNATKYLQERKPPLNIKTLKEIHKKMMKGEVDDLPASALGKIRQKWIVGNVPSDEPIDAKVYKELVENPYISVSMLEKSGSKYHGQIGYASPNDLTDGIKKIIKKKDSALYKELLEYEASKAGSEAELTSRLVNALTEDLMDWFVKQRDQIGSISTVAKLKKYQNLLARFQKGMISIHPFEDGNGRSIRQFALYYPAWLEGLPAPRISNFDADLYTSNDEWAELIRDGMNNSMELYRSIQTRLKNGLSIEGTPELLVPIRPYEGKIHVRYQKPAKTLKNKNTVEVDTNQFAEYVTVRLDDEGLKELFDENPDRILKQLSDEYLEFLNKSKMVYHHSKFGKEQIEVSLVDNDFFATFARNTFDDKKAFNYKMDRWYVDQTVWRGLADQERVIPEDELIEMFTKVDGHNVSNSMLNKLESGMDEDEIRKIVFEDFEQYNNDLVEGGLVRMAKDHSESGPLYGESYGYSTSQKRSVGKAFAMGAMVVAEYGQHMDHQDMLKSRVLVGMRRAKKDVELPRLKQLRSEFSYKYPRQREVMGIGAADPDSIQFVQTIDAEGKVILTYLRSPKDPKKILVFEGEVGDVYKMPTRRPVKTITLR